MVDVSSGRRIKRPNLLPALNETAPLYNTNPEAQKRFLAQRRMRGVSDLALGAGDLVNTAVNAGIRDIGFFAGANPDNVYQFPMPSQAAANLATQATGAHIVPEQTMPPAVQRSGANQRALMGMLPVGPEAVVGPALGILPPMMRAVKGGKEVVKAAEDVIPIIRAYHGSPHSFAPEPGAPLGRFRDTAIGTGEGAQAYGHGHYLAESEAVAKSYRDALGQVKIDGKPIDEVADPARAVAGMNDFGSYNLHKIKPGSAPDESIIAAYIGDYGDPQKAILQMGEDGHTGAVELARKMKAEGRLKDVGHMYEVNIKADPAHFLDWDKPLSEQPASVRARMEASVGAHPQVMSDLEATSPQDVMRQISHQTGGEIYFGLGDVFGGTRDLAGGAYSVPYTNEPVVSKILGDAGIPGIKYLDQGSRQRWFLDGKPIASNDYVGQAAADALNTYARKEDAITALSQHSGYKNTNKDAVELLKSGRVTQEGGSRNYVVFDPKIIEIVKKYGIVGALGLGLISQQDAKALAAQGVGGTEPASQPRSPNILGLK